MLHFVFQFVNNQVFWKIIKNYQENIILSLPTIYNIIISYGVLKCDIFLSFFRSPLSITSLHIKFIEHKPFLFFCFLVSLMFLFDLYLFFFVWSNHITKLSGISWGEREYSLFVQNIESIQPPLVKIMGAIHHRFECGQP